MQKTMLNIYRQITRHVIAGHHRSRCVNRTMKTGEKLFLSALYVALTQMVMFCGAEPDYEKRESLRRLLNEVEGKIRPDIPPYTLGRRLIDIDLTVGPLLVMDLDDASQLLSFRIYIQMKWLYEDLAWIPANYSKIDEIQLPQEKLWHPVVALINQIYANDHLDSTVPLVVRYDGMVNWQTLKTTSVSCKTDMSRYPFDTQKCHITFAELYGYDLQLNLHVNTDYTIDSEYNGEWTLIDIVVDTVFWNKGDSFKITLKRKNLFHILNLIFPMALLSVVNTLVFLLPATSGEKMSFLMAVFVSNAVFLTLIHESMPSTSDAMSNLSLYLVLIQLQGLFTIVATIAVQNVYHHRKLVEKNGLRQSSVKVGPLVGCDSVKDGMNKCPDVLQHQVVAPGRGKWLISPLRGNNPLDKVMDRIFFVISLTCAAVSFMYVFLRK